MFFPFADFSRLLMRKYFAKTSIGIGIIDLSRPLNVKKGVTFLVRNREPENKLLICHIDNEAIFLPTIGLYLITRRKLGCNKKHLPGGEINFDQPYFMLEM